MNQEAMKVCKGETDGETREKLEPHRQLCAGADRALR